MTVFRADTTKSGKQKLVVKKVGFTIQDPYPKHKKVQLLYGDYSKKKLFTGEIAPIYYSKFGLGHNNSTKDHLSQSFGEQYWFMYEDGRTLKKTDMVLEYILDGAHVLKNKDWIKPG